MTETIEIGKRETMVEAVAKALITYIATNNLRGGDQLPSERELVEMVGVSRLPLREALCILKGLGIVESRHGKGVFVRDLDVSTIFGMLSPLLRTQAQVEMPDIVEVRALLEASIAERAAAHRTEESLDVLRACLDGMRANLMDIQTFIDHDMAFHQELAKATSNPIFHVFMASITDLLREVQAKYPDKREYRETSIRYHEDILEAVQKQEGERARSVMEAHIREVGDRIWQESEGLARGEA
ncbi:MAG: FadR family transcriptional regulator [Planctomycetes bacterium]|nr:FadR family transcriptional regulator [Planctomycetota bacterium]